MKNIQVKYTLIAIILFSLVVCEEKKKDNTAATAAVFLLTQSTSAGSCTSSGTTAIANSTLGSTSPIATQFSVSGCNSTSLSTLGFSSQNISTGITGTTENSKIAANGDLFSANDVNIEVTFKLNSASGYLEVIGQGSGTSSTIDGPAIRINPASTQARATGSSTFTNITSQTITVGQVVTYCLEFHNESPSIHTVVWPTACTSVSSSDRSSYSGREATIASSFPGKRIGFILNGSTLTSFTVRTKIGIAALLQ